MKNVESIKAEIAAIELKAKEAAVTTKNAIAILNEELKKVAAEQNEEFELKYEFDFITPANYKAESVIAKFNNSFVPEHDECWAHISQQGFKNVSYCLVPDKKYRVKIFARIKVCGLFTSDQALCFLKKQNALLVGAQGLVTLFKDMPEKVGILSLDERERLWLDGEHVKAPFGVWGRSEGRRLRLGYFDGTWDETFHLLCVTEA